MLKLITCKKNSVNLPECILIDPPGWVGYLLAATGCRPIPTPICSSTTATMNPGEGPCTRSQFCSSISDDCDDELWRDGCAQSPICSSTFQWPRRWCPARCITRSTFLSSISSRWSRRPRLWTPARRMYMITNLLEHLQTTATMNSGETNVCDHESV
jgi:hypothetical protein